MILLRFSSIVTALFVATVLFVTKTLLRSDFHLLINFSPLLHFKYDFKFNLQRKSIDWFLYEMQHWVK